MACAPHWACARRYWSDAGVCIACGNIGEVAEQCSLVISLLILPLLGRVGDHRARSAGVKEIGRGALAGPKMGLRPRLQVSLTHSTDEHGKMRRNSS